MAVVNQQHQAAVAGQRPQRLAAGEQRVEPVSQLGQQRRQRSQWDSGGRLGGNGPSRCQPVLVGLDENLGRQPGLADTGLADEHHTAGALVASPRNAAKLLAAADQPPPVHHALSIPFARIGHSRRARRLGIEYRVLTTQVASAGSTSKHGVRLATK